MDEGVRYIELKLMHRSASLGESREASFAELLEAMGKMPLPPYMRVRRRSKTQKITKPSMLKCPVRWLP